MSASQPFKRPRPAERTTDARNLLAPKIYRPLNPPSSPGVAISVPRPYGTNVDDRVLCYPPEAAVASTSSFYGASAQPRAGERRDVHGAPVSSSGGAYGRSGNGFGPSQARPADKVTALLGELDYLYTDSRASAMHSHGGSSRDSYAAGAAQRQQGRQRSGLVVDDSPDKAMRLAAERRKRKLEEEMQDPKTADERFAASERREREKREGLAAARKKASATASSASSATRTSRPVSSVSETYQKRDKKGKSPKKDKRKEEIERAKERRKKDKGKQRVAYESDVDDSDIEPSKKSSGVTTLTGQLRTLRGKFTATPPASSSPEPAREAIPTLEEMMQQEQEAENKEEKKQNKGKGRAESEVVGMDLEDGVSSGRWTRADSPDELLEEYEDRPDSATLCPFCDQPFPDQPSRELLAVKATLLRNPHERRPTLKNKYAVRFPEGQHVVRTGAFCRMHQNERTIVPEGRARGYPTKIDWDGLPRRIEDQLKEHLTNVITGSTSTPFLAKARAAWDNGEWKSVLSEYGSFDIEEPGYYGPRGLELIKATLTDLFITSEPLITSRLIAPLSVDFYLRRVLVPECAVELIRADLGPDAKRAEAEQTRAESRAYGRAVFPNEGEAEERRDAARGAEGESPRKETPKHKKRKRVAVEAFSDEDDGEERDAPVSGAAAAGPAAGARSSTRPAPKAAAAATAFRLPKAQAARAAVAATSSASASSGNASGKASTSTSTGWSSKTTELTLPASDPDSGSDSEHDLVVVSPVHRRAVSPESPSPRKRKKQKKAAAPSVQAKAPGGSKKRPPPSSTLESLFAAQQRRSGTSPSPPADDSARLATALAEGDDGLEEVELPEFAARNRAREREEAERRRRGRADKKAKEKEKAKTKGKGKGKKECALESSSDDFD